MDLGLKQRRAWVAGASRGIGYAVAEALAREGAAVALGARDADGLAAAAVRLERATGAVPSVHPLDMADGGSVAAWAAACREELGDAEVCFVNSGGPPAGTFDALGDAEWRQAADLLLHGAVALAREVLPAMRDSGWGRILFLTSVSVRQPLPGLMLSNALRAGVQGFAKSLSNEAAASGVTVNCVAPGFTSTERLGELAATQAELKGVAPDEIEAAWKADIPLGRLAAPAEIAAVAAFLAGEPAGYVTGQCVTVDGGHARSLL